MKFFTFVFLVFLSHGYSDGFEDEFIGLPIQFDDTIDEDLFWKLKGVGDPWSANKERQTDEDWEETLAKLCRNNDMTLNGEPVDCESLQIIPKSGKTYQHGIRKREAEPSDLQEGSGNEQSEDEPVEQVSTKPDPIAEVKTLAEKPVVAETVVAEPVATVQVPAASVVTETVAAQPKSEKPAVAEAVAAESVEAKPITTGQVPAESVVTEALAAEPEAAADPKAAEPPVVESVAVKPVTTEPKAAEPVPAVQVPAVQEPAVQEPAVQGSAEQSPVEQTVSTVQVPKEQVPEERVPGETVKESEAVENKQSTDGKTGRILSKEYVDDKQSGNAIVNGNEGTIEDTEVALSKEKPNESIINAGEEPKSGQSSENTTKADAGNNKLLIGLFVAVVVVGAAAFTYNYVKKKKRPSNRRTTNGEARNDAEEGKEMKPLVDNVGENNVGEKVSVEYKDEKEEGVKA